jgi:hypothetical protein
MFRNLLTQAMGFFGTRELHQLNLVSKNFKTSSEGIPRLIKINGDILSAII